MWRFSTNKTVLFELTLVFSLVWTLPPDEAPSLHTSAVCIIPRVGTEFLLDPTFLAHGFPSGSTRGLPYPQVRRRSIWVIWQPGLQWVGANKKDFRQPGSINSNLPPRWVAVWVARNQSLQPGLANRTGPYSSACWFSSCVRKRLRLAFGYPPPPNSFCFCVCLNPGSTRDSSRKCSLAKTTGWRMKRSGANDGMSKHVGSGIGRSIRVIDQLIGPVSIRVIDQLIGPVSEMDGAH